MEDHGKSKIVHDRANQRGNEGSTYQWSNEQDKHPCDLYEMHSCETTRPNYSEVLPVHLEQPNPDGNTSIRIRPSQGSFLIRTLIIL
ncbi:hypothetical protein PVK06_039780 [Gossypium arboreum]|uniref:Uncharacterized protein n=1 Tax=Gossypium arboreum TaxID=29729 RepID=A0ABR0N5X6_GOSAR|nr:hypothetical protein PVK06_039780 [Gossypium arboreum]